MTFVTPKSLPAARHVRESAWLEHAPLAFWLMDALRPKTVVELGVHNGFSFLSFCQGARAAGLAATVYGVDTWRGDEHAGFYLPEIFDALAEELRAEYPDLGVMIRATFNEARPRFTDGSVDLLHIDGRHRYEDVREDFETWESALSQRGVVLFHDTQVRSGDFGVWRFWAEIATRRPSFEFTHGNGLGVLLTGQNCPPPLRALCAADEAERDFVRAAYARLGETNSLLWRCEAERRDAEKTAAALEAARAEYEAAEEERAEQEARAEVLRQRLALAAEQAGRTEAALDDQRRTMQEILSSRSWRLTAPYRQAGRQYRRAAHVSRALPTIVRRGGGWKATTAKAVGVLRREGLAGLKQRWLRANAPGRALVEAGGGLVDRNDYAAWLQLYGRMDDAARQRIRAAVEAMAHPPLISILMPVYAPDLGWLRAAVDSVWTQLYPHWELCMADDCSPDPAVRAELERLAALDPRIRVAFRPVNGHISAASNSAMAMARGDWLALMDQDDLLAEDALYEIARAALAHPQAGLIYSDEDKIDEGGRRFDPYFKPDWNPDLFLSHNMICHLGAYRADLARGLGGFREGLEGAQDYDLALRFAEALEPGAIVHVPKVLYHWRSHAQSTAQAGSNKAYALEAGKRALNDHFARAGVAAEAELLDFGMYRARYRLPDAPPPVTLIIPTRNGLALIRQCVDSILEKTTYPDYDIVIVDNNSDDPATLAFFDAAARDPRVTIRRDERPFNYSALNNDAVAAARGDYVALVNNDIEVITPGWLGEMVSLAMQPGVGAVGARLWYPDDSLQHGGVVVGLGGVAGHAHKTLPRGAPGPFFRAQLIQSFSAVTAACLVVNKALYAAVGGLNERDLAVAFNDVDFCLKLLKAGYRNVWTPHAELYHHESASRGFEDTPEKLRRFKAEIDYMHRVWRTDSWADPAYNPNLTLDREDFSLAWPPRGRD